MTSRLARRILTALIPYLITTVLGKGAIPETDPWSLGDMNSDAGSEAYGAAEGPKSSPFTSVSMRRVRLYVSSIHSWNTTSWVTHVGPASGASAS